MRASLRERLRYRFDNSLARGPSALIGYLGVAVFVLAVLFGLLVLLLSLGPTDGVILAIYNALLHVIDAGTVTGDDTSNALFIALQLVLTFGGIVIFSAFIGVIATAVDQRLSELRKGRSPVLESGHTLVLGWSDLIFTVLAELAIANESERDPSVVILADRDKVEMEDAIRARLTDLALLDHRPRRAGGDRPRELRPRHRDGLRRRPRRATRRRPHADHAAAPARHRRPRRDSHPDRLRDARRRQPRARPGHEGRRTNLAPLGIRARTA